MVRSGITAFNGKVIGKALFIQNPPTINPDCKRSETESESLQKVSQAIDCISKDMVRKIDRYGKLDDSMKLDIVNMQKTMLTDQVFFENIQNTINEGYSAEASVHRCVEAQCAMLEELGDYLDIYMTHWQSVEPCFTPIAETMDVLNDLKVKGKIKAIGAANVTREHIEEYVKYGSLDIVQGKYSILDRQVEKDLLPACRENGITFQAYSPLEQGLLSGKYSRDYQPKGAQANKKWFQPEYMTKAIDMMEKWKPLCEKYECSVANLALAWIMKQGDDITVLNGCSKVYQVDENRKAVDIELSDDDAVWMKQLADKII